MKIYWNPDTGETIESPSGGQALALRRQGWKASEAFGWASCYPWGKSPATFYLYKIDGKWIGKVIMDGCWAQERQAATAERLSKQGVELSQEDFDSLYADFRRKGEQHRFAAVVAELTGA